jgi:hypothetical protein
MVKQKSEFDFEEILRDKIRTNGGTQPRAFLDSQTVENYVEALNEGASFPPIVVFYDGKEYWLADGFHRLEAYKKFKKVKVTADIRSGKLRDAVLYSVGANAVHGLPRTPSDKRRSVIRLLGDEEWSQWSNVAIAQQCGVSEGLVRDIKQELSSSETKIGEEYATKFGIDRDILNNAINHVGEERTGRGRIARRGTSVYEIQVGNIGKSPNQKTIGDVPTQIIENEPSDDPPISNIFSLPRRKRAKDEGYFKEGTSGIASTVKLGDHWSIGLAHHLVCCEWDDSEFQKILPRSVNKLLYFPPKVNDIKKLMGKTLELYEQLLVLASPYSQDDIDLMVFRQMITSALEGYTNAGDIILISPLPDPALFILFTQLDITAFCAEPDPQRCQEAISAWNTSAETFHFSPAKPFQRKGKKFTTNAR